MRGLLLVLLTSFSITAMAEKNFVMVPTEIPCFPIKTLMNNLKDVYGEEPMLVGKSAQEEGVTTVVLVSQERGTYTVIEVGQDVGCVLSTGNSVKYRMPKAMSKSSM